jgi:hypothetical protein
VADPWGVKAELSVTSRAQAVPQIKIAQAVDISNFFIGRSSIVLVQQLLGYLDVAVSMRRWLKNRDALRATTPCAGKVAAADGAVRCQAAAVTETGQVGLHAAGQLGGTRRSKPRVLPSVPRLESAPAAYRGPAWRCAAPASASDRLGPPVKASQPRARYLRRTRHGCIASTWH